ncbi:hypothetical protein GCM10010400_68120 [Streptomyces aculeolatus]
MGGHLIPVAKGRVLTSARWRGVPFRAGTGAWGGGPQRRGARSVRRWSINR